VLVRPDGHVAWRGTEPPADTLSLIDRVRGVLNNTETGRTHAAERLEA
jgi:Aromatic-ring hydroxylase, C-terminal